MANKSNSPYLSVVIPAYNEADNIKKGVLGDVRTYLTKQKFTWEVLVVDDESTDDTLKLARNYSQKNKDFRVSAQTHRGKGGTVIAGMLEAKGQVVLFTDMDQATPISEFDKFIPKFKKGADVVIGVRAGREGAPLIRKAMAYGFSLLRSIILRLPYSDTQCGFKAFKQDASKEIFKRLKVFSEEQKVKGAAVTAGFDLEVLYVARKLGLTVAEVPVTWHHQETKRVNPLRDAWQGLRDLLKVRINAFEGKYRV